MIGIALGSVGCKRIKERLQEKAAEKIVEAATGGEVDYESGEGTVTLKGDNGSIVATGGGNVKVPDDWPSDVPLYTKGTLKATLGAKGTDKNMHYTLTYEAAEPPAEIVAFYSAGLSGYKKVSELNANDTSIVSFERDERVVAITVAPLTGKKSGANRSSLTVMVTSKG